MCHSPHALPNVCLISVALAFCLQPSESRAEELKCNGLRQPVEVLHDRWGIAHIYARDEHDLFFAQGFNVARDRLFQLEMWRRLATGTLAEIQGPRAFNRDLGARLLRFRGDISRELNRYHPRGELIVTAFVAGINAYIELTEREPRRLPLEFRALGIRPGRWTPEVVVSRHNGLFRNVNQEVQNARIVHLIGAGRARELLNLHPGHPRLEPDATLDLGIIDDQSLGPYPASRARVRFLPEDVEPECRSKDRRAADQRGLSEGGIGAAEADRQDAATQGSNNWVISPDRSFSRSAIMANDPHRAIEVPSLRYWVHLVAPGWNVIGAGEPALPGVSVGHNEIGAWGFTIFAIDQEDLYVYETDPADPTRYRYGATWEAMSIVRETIPVKGWTAMPADLRFTRHGPVIHEDREHHRAYALRAAWLLEGTAPYLASLRIDQAGSWDDFRQACAYFLTPSENMVWADVNGQIGWQAVGLAPNARTGMASCPCPATAATSGTDSCSHPTCRLWPTRLKAGFATANQDNLPLGYPHSVGFQWTDPFRFARIEEVLGSGRRWTMADMMRLQQDELSLPARTLVPMLRGITLPEGQARQAAERLASWNYVLDQDSVPAAIYVAWEKAVQATVWELLVPKEAHGVFLPSELSMERILDWLTAPDGRFGADPIAGRNTLLSKALSRAVSELEHRFGPDMSRWKYGQAGLKHIHLKHPLSGAVRADLQARIDLSPLPRGGYGHTVNSTSDNDNQSTGASFRIIADTGDWDRSVGTNTPGQSADPESPHYGDLFKSWAKGEYFPVLFSRSKVESVAEGRTVLVPRTDLPH